MLIFVQFVAAVNFLRLILVLSFDLNWRGSFGIACSSSNTFHAFSLHLPTTQDGASKPLHLIGTVELPHEGLAEVVIRPDGRLFATGGWDHRYVKKQFIQELS